MRIREPAHESVVVKHFNQEYIIPKDYENIGRNWLYNNKSIIPCKNCDRKVHAISSYKLSYSHKPAVNDPKIISKGKYKRFCSRKCLDEWFEKNKLKLIAEEI